MNNKEILEELTKVANNDFKSDKFIAANEAIKLIKQQEEDIIALRTALDKANEKIAYIWGGQSTTL